MLLQPSHAFLGPFAAHIVVYVSGATLVVHIVVALPELAGLGFGQRFLVLVVVSADDIDMAFDVVVENASRTLPASAIASSRSM